MVDAVDGGLPPRRQARDHQADGGAQVGGHHLGALKPFDPPHPGFAALDGDVRAQPRQFRHVHEAVFKDGLADDAFALGRCHQGHELGLQVGGEARIGVGLEVHRI